MNVLAGQVGDFLIGHSSLQDAWMDYPIGTFKKTVHARKFLNEAYTNRWMGRGETQYCPPRSSDLNSLGYCL